MRLSKSLTVGLVLCVLPLPVFANEWVRDVKITQLGAYQHMEAHFVWLSQPVSACQQANPATPVLHFSESSLGGKSLLSVITAALISRSNVDVQVNGCDIVEVYLKAG